MSDAKKLREKLNNLVKVDYIHDNPHITGLFVLDSVHDSALFGGPTTTSSLPLSSLPPSSSTDFFTPRALVSQFHSISANDKSIALNILSRYSDTLHLHHDAYQPRAELHKIFDAIHASSMNEGVKSQWIRHFGWVLG